MNKFSVYNAGPASVYIGFIKEIYRHFEGVFMCLVINESEAIEFIFTS